MYHSSVNIITALNIKRIISHPFLHTVQNSIETDRLLYGAKPCQVTLNLRDNSIVRRRKSERDLLSVRRQYNKDNVIR